MTPRPATERPGFFRLVTLAALVPFAVLVWRFDFVTDDAFISFCYAKNLALGHGPVFNAGELPVEGYSNFLWVVLCALYERVGLDVTVLSRVTGAVCGGALVLCVARFTRLRVAKGRTAFAATLGFLVLLPPVAVWSTGGLATMAFTLAVFATFERLLAEPHHPRTAQAALCAVLVVLLRADGFLWVGLIVLACVLTFGVQREPKLLRASLVVAGTGALALAALVTWRLAYYGDYLPNTARVKVGLSAETLARGGKYAASFLITFPSCLFAFLLPLVHVGRPRCGLVLSALGVAAGTFGYVVLVGGDYMTMGRFLVPGLPFLAILFGAGLQGLAGRSAARRGLVLAVSAVALGLSFLPAFDLHATPLAWREALHFRAPKPKKYRTEYMEWLGTTRVNARLQRLGKALSVHTRSGESITQFAVGAVKYYSDLHVYDQWGLTDATVWKEAVRREGSSGHDLGVTPDFFLERRPTYFLATVEEDGERASGPERMYGQPVEWVWHELSPEDGFEPGLSLRLCRVVYED